MPTSHSGQINIIVEILSTLNPSKVLDVGVGHGKYGFLTREYLDISKNSDDYTKRSVVIDGIEGFPQYITPLQRLIYDKIFEGDALKVIDQTGQYDLILLIDVFEHFTYEDGMALLEKCKARSKNILISCPKHMYEQGAEYGNEFETHRFEWKPKHFRGFNQKVFFPNYYSLIVLLGENAEAVKQQWKSTMFKIKLVSRYPWIRSLYFWLRGKSK